MFFVFVWGMQSFKANDIVVIVMESENVKPLHNFGDQVKNNAVTWGL